MKKIMNVLLAVTFTVSSLFSTAAYQAEHLWTAALLVKHGLDFKTARFFDAQDTENYKIAVAKAAALDGVSTLSQITSLQFPGTTIIRNTLNELKTIYFALIVNNEKMTVTSLPQLLALQTVFQSAYDTVAELYNKTQTEWLGLLLSHLKHDLLIIAKAVDEATQLNYRQQYLFAQQ